MPNTEDFIDQVLNQDFANSAVTFNDIMGDVMNQSLEQEKVRLADKMFNGVDPEERADEDQYEMDLDDPNMDDDDDDDYDAAAEEALDADDAEEEYEDDLDDGADEFAVDDEEDPEN